jgi:hypothetical protein
MPVLFTHPSREPLAGPPLSDVGLALAQSRRGLALPWLDADGRPLLAFCARFQEQPGPGETALPLEVALAIARETWDAMDPRERAAAVPILRAPRLVAQWIFAGVAASGRSPAFAPWRALQRRRELSLALARTWSETKSLTFDAAPLVEEAAKQAPLSPFSALCLRLQRKSDRTREPVWRDDTPPSDSAIGRPLTRAALAARFLPLPALALSPFAAHAVSGYNPPFVLAAVSTAAAFGCALFASAVARLALRIDRESLLVVWLAARSSLPLSLSERRLAKAKSRAAWSACGVPAPLAKSWSSRAPATSVLSLAGSSKIDEAQRRVFRGHLDALSGGVSLAAILADQERADIGHAITGSPSLSRDSESDWSGELAVDESSRKPSSARRPPRL